MLVLKEKFYYIRAKPRKYDASKHIWCWLHMKKFYEMTMPMEQAAHLAKVEIFLLNTEGKTARSLIDIDRILW